MTFWNEHSSLARHRALDSSLRPHWVALVSPASGRRGTAGWTRLYPHVQGSLEPCGSGCLSRGLKSPGTASVSPQPRSFFWTLLHLPGAWEHLLLNLLPPVVLPLSLGGVLYLLLPGVSAPPPPARAQGSQSRRRVAEVLWSPEEPRVPWGN